MIKKIIIVLLLVILWIVMFFVPRTYAFAPVAELPQQAEPVVPPEIASDPVKTYAYEQVREEWGEEHWEGLNNIIIRESRWDPTAQNSTSSAYGLGQLLTSTRKWLEIEKSSDPFDQIDETIVYIKRVYGTPNRAWAVWQTKSWY